MKIWKMFIVFQFSYIVLFYLTFIIGMIIGYGFFKNVSNCVSTITRVIVYPFVIVDKILIDAISREISHFIIVIITSIFVAAFFTALVMVIKAVVKKL